MGLLKKAAILVAGGRQGAVRAAGQSGITVRS